MNRFLSTPLAISGLALALVGPLGCSSSSTNSGTGGTSSTLDLALTGVPALGADYVYEGWLIDSDGPHSTGRFSVADDGTPNPSTFQVDAALAAKASNVVITIEPAKGDAPAPSATHFLAGPVTNGKADLGVAQGLGVDLSTAKGSFILATPSTASDMTDDDQGIWWLVPGATKTASLELPMPPDGWMYEGWVVGSNGPVSTGKFTDASGVDSDGTGPAAGKDPGPPFPGQDFVMPATMLDNSYKAVITVEPDPDNSPMPFAIKPLVAASIDGTKTAPESQQMSAGPAMPTGTATIM